MKIVVVVVWLLGCWGCCVEVCVVEVVRLLGVGLLLVGVVIVVVIVVVVIVVKIFDDWTWMRDLFSKHPRAMQLDD